MLTSYRQWVAAIPDSARARAEEEDEKKFAGRPDQVNGRTRRAVLRHDSGDFTIPVSVDGKVDDYNWISRARILSGHSLTQRTETAICFSPWG
jgi:hypothetical protein